MKERDDTEDKLTYADFARAYMALKHADVPGPYYYLTPDGWMPLERPTEPAGEFK